MSKKKPVVAIMYDFDKTLCTKDMQEYTFIPNLGRPNSYSALTKGFLTSPRTKS